MQPVVIRKRARSEEEKEARRDAILDAARALIEDAGFDAITMNALAQRAGLSKGTLYLYVRTKEELFLLLFVAAMEEMTQRMEDEATAENFLDLVARVPMEVPLFLPLLARLVPVIEANVADEPLFAGKRRMLACGRRMVELASRLSGASIEETGEAASVFMMAMQGAAQSELSAKRDLENMPEDLRPITKAHSFANGFPVATRLILGGLFRR